MSGESLSQEEIDKLMSGEAGDSTSATDDSSENQTKKYLTEQESDAIGEIGNISLGSASTTLSMLLGNKVEITAPSVHEYSDIKDVFKIEDEKCITVEIKYKKGLEGATVFVLNTEDASVIADLMMGGDGKPEKKEVGELQVSAVGEAMNQMIGTASTTLSSVYNLAIDITPPDIKQFEQSEDLNFSEDIKAVPVIAVKFNLKIGNLIDSNIIQIMSLESAQKQVGYLTSSMEEIAQSVTTPEAESAPTPTPAQTPASTPQPPVTVQPVQFASFDENKSLTGEENKNLNLVMDVKLELAVELGQTELPIKKVLELTRGSVIELDKIAGEPVDLYANGKIIAKGEVVVIEDNFGLRITSIVSPQNRINNL